MNSIYPQSIFLTLLFLGVAVLFARSKIGKLNLADRRFSNSRYLASILGVVLGLTFRISYAWLNSETGAGLMSFGFLFLSPFSIGYVHVWYSTRAKSGSVFSAITESWSPALLCMGLAGIVALEGLICILMAFPLWIFMASLGAGAALLVRLVTTGSFLLPTVGIFLPLLFLPLESLVPQSTRYKTVSNEIIIDASHSKVWDLIKSVELIKTEEQQASLFTMLGFPQPLEAKLVGTRVGAYRLATFAGGVEFHETITDWKEGELLSFSIKANTSEISPATLDPHITIGGQYFDVLDGSYRVEQISTKKTRLYLSSTHRLSTKFNLYAALWSRAIMSSVQKNILEVIKSRAERLQ